MAEHPRSDRGTVTAETAVALPSLLLVLGIALGAVEAAATRVACIDAARIGARALARGEDPAAARSAAERAAPPHSHVSLHEDALDAEVTVRAPVRVGPLDLPSLTVAGHAVTPMEPEW